MIIKLGYGKAEINLDIILPDMPDDKNRLYTQDHPGVGK
jgi:hypothetical protein